MPRRQGYRRVDRIPARIYLAEHVHQSSLARNFYATGPVGMPDRQVFCGLPIAYAMLGKSSRFAAILGCARDGGPRYSTAMKMPWPTMSADRGDRQSAVSSGFTSSFQSSQPRHSLVIVVYNIESIYRCKSRIACWTDILAMNIRQVETSVSRSHCSG